MLLNKFREQNQQQCISISYYVLVPTTILLSTLICIIVFFGSAFICQLLYVGAQNNYECGETKASARIISISKENKKCEMRREMKSVENQSEQLEMHSLVKKQKQDI